MRKHYLTFFVSFLAIMYAGKANAEESNTASEFHGSGTVDDPYGGSCGNNCTWSLDPTTHALNVGPSGSNTSYSITSHPWTKEQVVATAATSINIAEGISNIPGLSFDFDGHSYSPDSVTSINIPEGVKYIGIGSFTTFKSVESLTLPSTVTSIDQDAFRGMGLKEVFCTEAQLASDGVCSKIKFEAYDSDKHGSGGGYMYVGYMDQQRTPTIGKYEDVDGERKYYLQDSSGEWQEYDRETGQFKTASSSSADNKRRRRIYTVEEATAVSKDTGNTFRLRYK